MNRPRILHLRASNFVGGPEKQLLRYAESERDGPLEIWIGTFLGDSEGTEFFQAIEVRGLKAVPLAADALSSSFRAVVRTLRENQVRLLCTHSYKADILGLVAGRLTGIPVACFLRGWTGEDRKVRMYESLGRLLLPLANRVVCLSENRARYLSNNTPLMPKIHLISNAIDIDPIDVAERAKIRKELRQRFSLPVDCPVVAAAGRLSPEKGTRFFLDAAAILAAVLPEVRFIIFGEGALRKELERQSRDLGVADCVTFAGFQPDLRKLLAGVDLLLNPSLSEEMPNIVLEAMAAQIPIVATAVGGVPELARYDAYLVLAPPANAQVLAHRTAELLGNPEWLSRLSRSDRCRVGEVFSLDRQRAQMHTLYSELLPSGALPASIVNEASIRESPGAPSSYPESFTPASFPLISVIVPVRNEEAHLTGLLTQLLSQDYPKDRYEILVVDGNSTDDTARIIDRMAKTSSARIVLLLNRRQLSSAGRNAGIRHARGEFIVFVDGHCHIPSQRLLRDTVRLFAATCADCLCRPQPLSAPGISVFQEVVAHARRTIIGHGRDSKIYSTNLEGFVDPTSSGASYRRSVFAKVGLYDEDFDACEDVEFNFRLRQVGYLAYISPSLTVLYCPRDTFKGLWGQMMRYGRGRFRLSEKHHNAWSVSQAVPAALVVWLVVGIAGSVFSARVASFILPSLAVYLGILFLFSLRMTLQYGRLHLLLAPAVFLTIHLGLGVGFLTEAWTMIRNRFAAWAKWPSRSQAQSGKTLDERHTASIPPSYVAKQDPQKGFRGIKGAGSEAQTLK